MVEKVPSPFDSPFAKVLLAAGWLAYAGMVIALIVTGDPPLFILVPAWSLILPWITWNFLSGVRVERGRSVGGGPMYPKVALDPGEDILFNAPLYASWSAGGHLFVTNGRLIALPIRFYGATRTVRLSDITAVKSESEGWGWPMPRESVSITFSDRILTLRPWAVPQFMGGSTALTS